MTFILSSTFTDSLARLAADEQKLVKTTSFDLQVNPANPGHSFHKIDSARDKAFWSVRVSSDLRIIVHKTPESLMLCYVDHHDKAYAWAERRKIETHPNTGAAQIVEIREIVKEMTIPKYVESDKTDGGHIDKPLAFASFSDDVILGWGVPGEWIADIKAATEDSILDIADHLPAEAAEAVLAAATGTVPNPRKAEAAYANPFEHPDAQRRFRILGTSEELERALESPWDKWITFLHPDQRELVDKDFSGPARVSGSAGTGKTIVALHRAVSLAKRFPENRVLLATFSNALANALHDRLKRLIVSEPRLGERIDVLSMEALGLKLFSQQKPDCRIIDDMELLQILQASAKKVAGHSFNPSFLKSEWDEVFDAWDLTSWDEYRDIARLGRKTRLPEAQRQKLWEIFSLTRGELDKQGYITNSGMFNRLAGIIKTRKHPPYDNVVVDEAQDISIAQLRFLAAFGAKSPNRLFFSGDTGQRIFRQAFSWKALGVDMQGRCRTLCVNYRTSHQIRMQADLLLGREVSDIDGNVDARDSTVSLFNGPPPEVLPCIDRDEEVKKVVSWIKELVDNGLAAHEICLCVRSEGEIGRAHQAAVECGLPFAILDEDVNLVHGRLSICTMHLAKGLEFRAIGIMACDDEVLPLQERIDALTDVADLEEIYNTERQLFYVACTRARDFLLVVSGGKPSEFLMDIQGK
jgi:hypothetical protein